MYNTLLPYIVTLKLNTSDDVFIFCNNSHLTGTHLGRTISFPYHGNNRLDQNLKSWNLTHLCLIFLLFFFLKYFFSKLSLFPKSGAEGVVSWEKYLLLIGSAWWPHWNGEDQKRTKNNFRIIWTRQNSPILNRYGHPTRRQQPYTSSTAFKHPHPTAVAVADRKPARSFSTVLIHCR